MSQIEIVTNDTPDDAEPFRCPFREDGEPCRWQSYSPHAMLDHFDTEHDFPEIVLTAREVVVHDG